MSMKVVNEMPARKQGGVAAEAAIEFTDVSVGIREEHGPGVFGHAPAHFVLQFVEHAGFTDPPSDLEMSQWSTGAAEGTILLPAGTERPKPKKTPTRAQRAVLINSAKLRVATEKNPPRWIVNLAQKTP